MKYLKFLLCFIIVYSCANSETELNLDNRSFVFVACEGNFGASNGSIHLIDENGETSSVNDIGDVVQSLEVFNNKLFVIVNNSHKIIAYDITENGLSLPGIEVSTNGSGPREMVIVNDNLYFTNWNTNDVKILNLFNYTISDFISFEGKPESIIYDNNNLYVGIQLNNDYSDSNLLYEINISSGEITNEFEIGYGPTSIIKSNDDIYIANTYYDENFNAFFSTSRVDLNTNQITINNYGDGVVCGGSVHKINNDIYRSYDGGIVMLDDNLNFINSTKIGDEESNQVYSSEIINDKVYFGITNFTDINLVKIYNSNNELESTIEAGLFPGDFAYWEEQ
tara:strand:+ start:158 stop:1168 length:1011 start_codon:yes stop_codon:yes gene_type:complete